MAIKAATDPGDVDELLDTVDKTLERLRTMYEQYFLGIQKQAPTYIHNDVERKLRDLTQMQLRNTGLRYRLATLQQKFGSYNSYWRRTLRQIEQGTYFRNLSKVGREAIRTGADIPDEILAAMPKRMREQVVRDREQALAIARRRGDIDEASELPPEASDEAIAMIKEPTELRRNIKTATGAHILDAEDADLDLEAFFASVEDDAPKAPAPLRAASITTPPSMRAARTTGAPIQTQTQPRRPPTRATGSMQAVTPPTTPVVPTTRQTGQTGSVPVVPTTRQTGSVPVVPTTRQTGSVPVVPSTRDSGSTPVPATLQTGSVPVIPTIRQTGSVPVMPPPTPPQRQTGPVPRVPAPAGTTGATGLRPIVPSPGVPSPIPATPSTRTKAPSQVTRPTPIVPGAAAAQGPVPVESMAGPFPRAQTPPTGTPIPRPAQPRPASAAPQRPPPGMSDADVNALYAKYVKAKEMVGEKVGPGEHGKLLKTINAQAPKIMEQYKAKAVDFSVVVKDNQVIIRAKPKT